MLKTYTPTTLRQKLFTVLEQSLKKNDTIQITCSSKSHHLKNDNFYILNQNEFESYRKYKQIAPLINQIIKRLQK